MFRFSLRVWSLCSNFKINVKTALGGMWKLWLSSLLTIEETDFEPEPNVSPPVSGKVSKSPESEICRF